MQGWIVFYIILGVILAALMAYVSTAETARKAITVYVPAGITSRRCTECQMHPQPADMELFFGKDWRINPICTRCRGDLMDPLPKVEVTVPVLPRGPALKAYLVVAPKIYGLPPDRIREWYVPQPARKAARERNYSFEHGKSFKLYVTDGLRFWTWSDFLRQPHQFIGWTEFNEAHKVWAVLVDSDGNTAGFEHIKV